MQAAISASRCFRSRARELLLRTTAGKNTMMISSHSSCSTSDVASSLLPRTFTTGSDFNHVFTRQISVRRSYPWDVTSNSRHFLKHLTAFVSDFSSVPPHKPHGSMVNGHALFTTSSGSDVKEKKPNIKEGEKDLVEKGETIDNMKILSRLAKYLWMKDNIEFKLRVLTALGFLVGAKVLNVQVPFLFKLAVDWLTTAIGNPSSLADFAAANPTALAVFVSPAVVLIGYGIAQIGASAFNATSL